MRKNFGSKPYMYPMPVLIIASYDENGVPNAMNAAWGCMADSDRIAMYLSLKHKTVSNILSRRAFTVSIADEKLITEADFFGLVSGNDVADKVQKSGLHTEKSEFVDAPVICEFKMTLECELVSYDTESELMIGQIINVSADESALGDDGNIDPGKLKPITYDPVNRAYVSLDKPVGKAFSDGRKLK